MTTPARIRQEDMTRATKAVAAAGIKAARIVMDLESRRIEIIIGEQPESHPAPGATQEWTDADI